jgi:hypothetical protein
MNNKSKFKQKLSTQNRSYHEMSRRFKISLIQNMKKILFSKNLLSFVSAKNLNVSKKIKPFLQVHKKQPTRFKN